MATGRNNADVLPEDVDDDALLIAQDNDDDSALLLAQGNTDASPTKTLDKLPSDPFGEILLFCGDTLDDPMPLISSRTKEIWEDYVKWRTAEIAALFKYPFQFIPDSSLVQRYNQIVAARNRFSADLEGLLFSAYSTSQQQLQQDVELVTALLGRNPVIEFEHTMLVECSSAIALRADYVVEQELHDVVNTLVDRSRLLFEEATEPRDEERTAYVEALYAQLGCRQRQLSSSHSQDDFDNLISVARTILRVDPRNPVGLITLTMYYFRLQDIHQGFHSAEVAIRSACSHARYACVTHSYCERLLTMMEDHLTREYWQNRIIALFRDAISSLGRLLERNDLGGAMSRSDITSAKTEIESMLSIRLGVDNEE